MKKLLSLLLTGIILVNIYGANKSFASEKVPSPERIFEIETEEEINEFYKSIDNMNVEDLQKVIDYAKINSENRSSLITSYNNLRLAWYAAAKIARLKGYPLSATLVEYSLRGKNYYETNGQFAKAIRKTSLYKGLLKEGEGSSIFTRKISKDLYYSIKKFNFTSYGGNNGIVLKIYDEFNFEFQNSFKDGTFSTLVNNWAYLNQGIYILKNISVTINIDYR